MPTPLRLSPRATTPRGLRGRSPRRAAGSGRATPTPAARAFRGAVPLSPGARVVDVERYTREVPRTVYDEEAYDVRIQTHMLCTMHTKRLRACSCSV